MSEETIFRVRKDKRNPYVQIHKAVFEDKKLSWAAKGLLGYLLSKPDNWKVRYSDLIKHGPAKRHAIRRIVKELEEYGYIQRNKIRNKDGTFTWHVDVYESPKKKGLF